MNDDRDGRLPRAFETESIPVVAEDPTAHRGRQLAWLIVGQVLTGLSLVLWLVIAIVTTVAVSSEGSAGAWIFGLLVWAYPVWPVGFSIAAWIYWGRGRATWAGMLIALAFLPGLLLLGLVALSAL